MTYNLPRGFFCFVPRGFQLACRRRANVNDQVRPRFPSASDTFNEVTRHSAWGRMSAAGAQLMTWFGVACELHRDWRNDVEGLATLFANHIPDYRNLINSHRTGK